MLRAMSSILWIVVGVKKSSGLYLLLEDIKYLLEIDSSSFHRDSLEKQSYWVLVMQTAVKAEQYTLSRLCNTTVCQL